jgi:peroxiredoxin
MPSTILYEDRSFETPEAHVDDAGLWLPLKVVADAIGWEHKPEGICRDDVCVPVPPDRESVLFRDSAQSDVDLNLTEFARLIEQPFAHDDVNDAWYFGPPAWEWKDRLSGGIAPDFELPDFEGRLHRLSEHRGSKVLLVLWASWCGCRFDLPVWNNLREELHPQGFEVITVDCDSKGIEAGRSFVDAANASHPSLFDGQHVVPALYNTTNVPAVFWIAENGRIVRANDPIYATRRNQETGETTTNTRYLDAVRDWVAKGDASEHVQGAPGIDSVAEQSWENVQGLAHFRLGVWLHQQGHPQQAIAQFKQAHALAPGNYNYRRQAYNLGRIKEDYGYESMREIMQQPGAAPFYRQVELTTMPR